MEKATKIHSFYNYLQKLKDPRRKQGQRHSLDQIILIIIMSIMSGSIGIRAIGEFAQRHKEDLIKYLNITRNKVPSTSTINRLIQKINFEELAEQFYQWTKQFVVIDKEEWYSIDGKAIKGTLSNANTSEQKFINLISIFNSQTKQVLKAGKINTKKTNEIPKVQELLQSLDLEGVIFTIDALHCQKETTKTIIEGNNNYVIGVKKNQKKLYNQIKKKHNNLKQETEI